MIKHRIFQELITLTTEYPYSRYMGKLTDYDYKIINSFIDQHFGDDTNPIQTEFSINRLWNDKPDKTKNWKFISEILLTLNNRRKGFEND